MQHVVPFDFQNHAVRVFSDDPLNPMFVAVDVARALGYAKPENAISRHCWRTSTTPKQGGGFLTLIPESDLYRLTFRSKLQSAEAFTDWVVTEVLPSIRTSGKYEMPRKGLTPAQQRHIQIAVGRHARAPGNSFPAVYRSIKDHFQVGSYKDVPEERYSELCKFLNVAPMPEEVRQVQAVKVQGRRQGKTARTQAEQTVQSPQSREQCMQQLKNLFQGVAEALEAMG